MTIAQWAAAAVGAVVLAWPHIPAAFSWLLAAVGSQKATMPSYRDTLYYLAQVRLRLSATGALNDDQKRAIDILTLALVDGSDK